MFSKRTPCETHIIMEKFAEAGKRDYPHIAERSAFEAAMYSWRAEQERLHEQSLGGRLKKALEWLGFFG